MSVFERLSCLNQYSVQSHVHMVHTMIRFCAAMTSRIFHVWRHFLSVLLYGNFGNLQLPYFDIWKRIFLEVDCTAVVENSFHFKIIISLFINSATMYALPSTYWAKTTQYQSSNSWEEWWYIGNLTNFIPWMYLDCLYRGPEPKNGARVMATKCCPSMMCVKELPAKYYTS